mmetsp:Transcript_25341/g.60573  ORF Transcript_25341/g.60573 Transcript_25341/m.60573 type:complete len:252 (-) Transcript_25341:2458-3213(-)
MRITVDTSEMSISLSAPASSSVSVFPPNAPPAARAAATLPSLTADPSCPNREFSTRSAAISAAVWMRLTALARMRFGPSRTPSACASSSSHSEPSRPYSCERDPAHSLSHVPASSRLRSSGSLSDSGETVSTPPFLVSWPCRIMMRVVATEMGHVTKAVVAEHMNPPVNCAQVSHSPPEPTTYACNAEKRAKFMRTKGTSAKRRGKNAPHRVLRVAPHPPAVIFCTDSARSRSRPVWMRVLRVSAGPRMIQ